ncbi:MAG: polyprenyl synthetase family protein [Deltaproteobacteria bacterium]|nr:polyprenyl synthetase family protein [Deltaproteobacteria bacterium]
MDLKAYLAKRKALVDQALEKELSENKGPAEELSNAMSYSLFAGGKRLRPILCLAGAEAAGASIESAMPAAVALEMVHTYSLIHDDLPVMDDDDLRRGKPTNHKVFGEATAILAGDGLLTEGFGVLIRAGSEGRADPHRALAALEVIARAAGTRGMVAGQVLDLAAEGRDMDIGQVQFIHGHKSGKLIAASVTSGGILGGADKEQTRLLDRYGQCAGLAFQIVDDILDIEGDPEVTGKMGGMDEVHGKATFPGVVGREKSWEMAKDLIAKARASLAEFGSKAEPLHEIAAYFLTRRK